VKMTEQSNYERAQNLTCPVGRDYYSSSQAASKAQDKLNQRAIPFALLAIADELRALRETLLTRSEGMPLATLTRHDPPGAEPRGPRR